MNIFILDYDQRCAAQSHCDKHIVKMPLELVQMACINYHFLTGKMAPYPPHREHTYHPCTKWMRQSLQNFNWSLSFGAELFEEYSRRYKRVHASQKVLEWFDGKELPLDDVGLTPFAKAMKKNYPELFNIEDPVEAYRWYYILDKSRFAKWKYSNVPEWYPKYLNEYEIRKNNSQDKILF